MFGRVVDYKVKKENYCLLTDNNFKITWEIKEKITDNKNFINILRQYDELLSGTSDNESIKIICNQVLSRYEELVNGKD